MNAAVLDLFDGVDDLIKRVADSESPEIRKVRAKVHAAMVVAKSAVGDDANEAVHARPAPVETHDAGQALEDAGDMNGKLDGYPPQALGVALLVGLGLGLMVSLRD
jgi:ElaB/YqjD/DUF883 family membrane-anchored ribosome-binding protein